MEYKPNPARIYLFKVNNRNTRTSCVICCGTTSMKPTVYFEQVNAGWEEERKRWEVKQDATA